MIGWQNCVSIIDIWLISEFFVLKWVFIVLVIKRVFPQTSRKKVVYGLKSSRKTAGPRQCHAFNFCFD